MGPAGHSRSRGLLRAGLTTALALGLLPGAAAPGRAQGGTGVPASENGNIVAPSNLRGAPLASTRVRLVWQDNSCAEVDQRLEVFLANRWQEVPFSLGADTTSLIITGLAASTDYDFRITAKTPEDRAIPSRGVRVRTLAADPTCRPGRYNLCLLDGRYRVEIRFQPASGAGLSGRARALPDSDRGGFFWFFSPLNLELAVEILALPAAAGAADPSTGLPGTEAEIGFRFGGLTDLAYRLVVTDTTTGETRVFTNPEGDSCGREEPRLFARRGRAPKELPRPSVHRREIRSPAPESLGDLAVELHSALFDRPGRAEPSCARDPAALGLANGRFEIDLRWNEITGDELAALAVDGTDDSGFFVVEEGNHPDWAVKILDGREINGSFWVFSAPLGRLGGRLTIRDRETGATSFIDHPSDEMCLKLRLSDFP